MNVDLRKFRKRLSVYPNPNNGQFTIQLPKRLGRTSNLIIQNTLGQIIHQESTESANNLAEINLENVASGLYLITIRNGNNIYNTKLLIEK